MAGTADNLNFSVQPSNTPPREKISSAVTVQVRDSSNNIRTEDNSTIVTISLSNNPTKATLSGTLSRVAVNGIATFSSLSINRFGIAYTLRASSDRLTRDTSSSFNILSAQIEIRKVLNKIIPCSNCKTKLRCSIYKYVSQSAIRSQLGKATSTLAYCEFYETRNANR